MMESEIKLLDSAYKSYNLEKRDNIANLILKYIKDRFKDNQDNFKKILDATGEDISVDEIFIIIDSQIESPELYKRTKKLEKIDNEKFLAGIYETSIGKIAVELSNPIDALDYMLRAIVSRNAVVISDIDYDEYSIKQAFLLIIKEALKKYNVDSNLIMIMPYEECYYDDFDKLIKVAENEVHIIKDKSKKLIIYVEDEHFLLNAQSDKAYLEKHDYDVDLFKGISLEDAIDLINEDYNKASCIYTSDYEKGYKFVNLVNSENCFVNASLYYMDKKIEDPQDQMYRRKKIIYPTGTMINK